MKNKIKLLSILLAVLCVSVVFGVIYAGADYTPMFDYYIRFVEEKELLTIRCGDIGTGMETFYQYHTYNTPWFGYSKKAKKVSIGENIDSISQMAFPEFTELEVIYIPAEVKYISKDAFYDCTPPGTIYFGGTQQAWEEMTKELEGYENSTVYYNVAPCTEHEFINYVSNNDATYTSDGTKTAVCSKSDLCGEKNTVTDEGSKLVLGNVTNLTFKSVEGGAEIKWDKVKDATGYAVFQRAFTNSNIYQSKWELVEYTTNSNCTIKLYDKEIAVRAFMIRGNSLLWAPKYEKIWVYSLTTSPKELKTSQIGATNLTLTWSDDYTGTGVTLFMLTEKGWKALGTVTYFRENKFTVYGLEPLKSYTFAARTFRRDCNVPIVWADKYTTFTVKTNLGSVGWLANDTPNVIAWTGASKGVTGYQVWYFKKGDTKYTKLGNFSADTREVRLNLEKGTTYAVRVRAYAKVGNTYVYTPFTYAKAIKIK